MKIFITGGTSGIGQELAKRYLQRGDEVGICGRDLQKVELPHDAAGLYMYQLDVYDRTALDKAVREFCKGDGLDLMIIAAGTYTESIIHRLSYKESTDMLRVNIVGTLNAFEVAREVMGTKRQGHIAAIASVSALLDYPQSSLYSKTKRTVLQLCDAYRMALKDFGISVTAIAPGYVDTPKLRELNGGDLSRKPFVVSCEYAAGVIMEAIDKKKELTVFPPKMKRLIYSLSAFPDGIVKYIMQKKAQWSQTH